MSLQFCFAVLCFITVTHSFLFDSSTKNPVGTGSGLAEQQYRDLLDLIMQERKYRRQIEQYITGQLQQELQDLKNETSEMKITYKTLQIENSVLQGVVSNLENKTGTYKNFNDLELDVNRTLEITRTEVIDFDKFVSEVSNNMSSVLTEMSFEIKNLSDSLDANSQIVSLQACGGVPYYDFSNNYFSGIQMTFTDIKFSHGFSNLTSLKTNGKFVCETAGLYLVFVTIGDSVSNRRFSIVLRDVSRNFDVLSSSYVTPYYTNARDTDMYHTSAAAAVVELKVNDTVYVDVRPTLRMKTQTNYNCISIVKLH